MGVNVMGDKEEMVVIGEVGKVVEGLVGRLRRKVC